MRKLFNPDDKLADFIDRHAGIVIACMLLLALLMDSFA
jgi:hypothetical protein